MFWSIIGFTFVCFVHRILSQCITTPVSKPSIDDLKIQLVPDQSKILFVRGSTFRTQLYLNERYSDDLKFICSVLSDSELQTLTESQLQCNTSIDDDWMISHSVVTIDTMKLSPRRSLTITRTQSGVSFLPTREYVQVTCCYQNAKNISYPNLSTYMIAQADLRQVVTLQKETTTIKQPNPAFVELAPCSCDLTPGECDIHCCCDKTCEPEIGNLFVGCIHGLHGGQPEIESFRCTSTHFDKPDWFPLLCVYSEMNALLGKHYMQDENGIKDASDVRTRKEDTAKNLFSYQEMEARVVADTKDRSDNYTFAEIIKTGFPKDDTFVAQNDKSEFILPQKVLNGECLDSAPVRFLKNINSHCNYIVNEITCESNPVFNMLNYPVSSSVLLCHRYVLKNSTHIAKSSITYKCPDLSNVNLAKLFVKTRTMTEKQNVSHDLNFTAKICEEKELIGNCENFTEQKTTYDANNSMCLNVVLATKFVMKWKKGQLEEIQGEITVGNVDKGQIISQQHSVEYIEYKVTPPTVIETRSGNPGIQPGKPVIAGKSLPRTVDTDLNLKLFKTDVSGLCETSSCRDVEFGYDAMSSCILKLSLSHFDNCLDLRRILAQYLDRYMPSDLIFPLGWHKQNVLQYTKDHWVKIYRQNIDSLLQTTSDSSSINATTQFQSDLLPTNDSIPKCANLNATTDGNLKNGNDSDSNSTNTLPLCVNISDTGLVNNDPVSNTLIDLNNVLLNDASGNATNNNTNTTTTTPTMRATPRPVFKLKGWCFNMTTGIHIDIVYSMPGRSYGVPTYQIMGARINYTISDMRYTCANCYTTENNINVTATEDFILTTSVRFIQVPPQPPSPVIKYWKENLDEELCMHDSCWREFMYPIKESFRGDTNFYTVAVWCLLFLIIFFYFLALKPR